MATKFGKVRDINQAIKHSSVALKKDAKAELLRDGRIEYSMLGQTSTGKPYRMKVTLMQILSLLQGEDMRRLHRLYGK